jgi:hypothetical protein
LFSKITTITWSGAGGRPEEDEEDEEAVAAAEDGGVATDGPAPLEQPVTASSRSPAAAAVRRATAPVWLS